MSAVPDAGRDRAGALVEPIGGATAPSRWDVVVVGAGAAGLAAAGVAGAGGARVLVLDAAPRWQQGGATRHALALHRGAPTSDAAPGSASELTELLAAAGPHLAPWLAGQGVRFQPPPTHRGGLASTHRFLLGGGRALLNAQTRTARRAGVVVAEEVRVVAIEGGLAHLDGVLVGVGGRRELVRCRTLVVATGGGGGARGPGVATSWPALVPASTDSSFLEILTGAGASTRGGPEACHLVSVDARAPAFDGGVAVRVDPSDAAAVVDVAGNPVHPDPGDDPFAAWGSAVARCSDGRAFAFWDRRSRPWPRLGLGATTAADLGSLAPLLGEATGGLEQGVRGAFVGPLLGVALRPGVLARGAGLSVDDTARVLDRSGHPFDSVFAAGDVMAPSVSELPQRSSLGLLVALVFGRIAGQGALEVVRGG